MNFLSLKGLECKMLYRWSGICLKGNVKSNGLFKLSTLEEEEQGIRKGA